MAKLKITEGGKMINNLTWIYKIILEINSNAEKEILNTILSNSNFPAFNCERIYLNKKNICNNDLLLISNEFLRITIYNFYQIDFNKNILLSGQTAYNIPEILEINKRYKLIYADNNKITTSINISIIKIIPYDAFALLLSKYYDHFIISS